MNSFFFGTSSRQLFGAYEPPADRDRGGIVLCHPMGQAYLFSHPTFRLLSRRLSEAGYHVLRFDYFGTGDSAGDFEESGRESWLADIGTAVDELKDMAGLRRAALLGMRVGASLAAQAACARSDIDQLVLWDVVVDGRAYLQEIGATEGGPADNVEANGLVFTARMRHELEGITLDSFRTPLPRTLVISTTDPVPLQIALQARLAAAGVDCVLQQAPDVSPWRDERMGSFGMPVAAMKGIVEWMS